MRHTRKCLEGGECNCTQELEKKRRNQPNEFDVERDVEVMNYKERAAKRLEAIGLNQVNSATRLLDKQYSPLIVRKYQMHGWPLFVSLICDVSLSDLDEVVHDFAEHNPKQDDIQWIRNFCGGLSDHIREHYETDKRGCVEGVAVLWYVDKCFVSSLWGDFMVHASCKQELFGIINTLPHI